MLETRTESGEIVRFCSKCGRWLTLDCFYHGGKNKKCRECCQAVVQARRDRARHVDRIRCKRCGEYKTMDWYYVRHDYTTGHDTVCIACRNTERLELKHGPQPLGYPINNTPWVRPVRPLVGAEWLSKARISQ